VANQYQCKQRTQGSPPKFYPETENDARKGERYLVLGPLAETMRAGAALRRTPFTHRKCITQIFLLVAAKTKYLSKNTVGRKDLF
jgi:hypothetical protein